jgi:hypothetical protein
MYDYKYWKSIEGITVAELVAYLTTLPQDAIVTIDGSEHFYSHLTKDRKYCTFDDESLSDLPEYENVIPDPLVMEDWDFEFARYLCKKRLEHAKLNEKLADTANSYMEELDK